MNPRNLTPQELAQILAALRFVKDNDPEGFHDTPQFEDTTPMNDDEVDALCEFLNFLFLAPEPVDMSPCDVCHGQVGHVINCPKGIAFTKGGGT